MLNFLMYLSRRRHARLAFCIVAGASDGALAAEPEPVPVAAQVTAITPKSLNGYGESLRPTARKKATAPDKPYNPIKMQDDQGQIPEIEMFVGESRVFPAPNVGRIAVGNGQIMTAAALDRKEVIVFANGAGTSSLFVWNEDGRYQRIKVNIVAGDTSRVAREVAAFLSTIPKAKASIVGDKVIVDGDGMADADLQKIEQLEKRYPQIVNFTNKVGWEQMVFMDVKVVEFPRSELKEIGLKWGAVGGTTFGAIWSPLHFGRLPPGAQYQINIPSGSTGLPITSPGGAAGPGGAVLPTSLNLLSGLNLGLNAQLNLLEQQGRASILAEPQLSARNGAKASFLAGGEFPYSVSNNNGVTIIFKPYGIKLDITPKVDRNGVVRATVQSEVSSIDASVTAVGGPALLTRRTETEFNVQAGETIVLSGLLQRNASTDIDKVPLLGDLPVLGALFRSKRFQNKETELVVFVTPSIIDSRSPGLIDRVKQTTSRLEEQLGQQPYLTDPLQPGRPAADANRTSVPPAIPSPAVPAPAMSPVIAPADALIMQNETSSVSPAVSARVPGAATPYGAGQMQVTSRMATLRTDPNRSSAALLYLAKGTIVEPGTRSSPASGAWRAVTVGAIDGWILASAVSAVPAVATPSNSSEPVVAPAPRHEPATQAIASVPTASLAEPAREKVGAMRYRVVVDGLAMRATPDISAVTLSRLAAGSVVDALPQPSKGYWTAIEAGGQHGWVATQWLTADQPLAQR